MFKGNLTTVQNERVVPKAMPPTLLCCPMMSEADVGGMAEQAEPSHQHPIPFCCCVTDGSRGALWQNGAWHGSVGRAKGWNWIPPCRRNGTHWHLSTLVKIYGDWTVGVSALRGDGAFQQCWQWQWSPQLVQIFWRGHSTLKSHVS